MFQPDRLRPASEQFVQEPLCEGPQPIRVIVSCATLVSVAVDAITANAAKDETARIMSISVCEHFVALNLN